MKTYAILHGWAEGPWQSRKFEEQLQSKLSLSEDIPTNADLIIAHSLGCFLVPENAKAKYIVLIGPPYWPKRSVIKSLVLKLASELKSHRKASSIRWWGNKIMHNVWYIFSRPKNTVLGVIRRHPKYLPGSSDRKVILVRPSQDTLCHPDIFSLIGAERKYEFVEIKGAHDDCWFEPKEYVDLLLKELK